MICPFGEGGINGKGHGERMKTVYFIEMFLMDAPWRRSSIHAWTFFHSTSFSYQSLCTFKRSQYLDVLKQASFKLFPLIGLLWGLIIDYVEVWIKVKFQFLKSLLISVFLSLYLLITLIYTTPFKWSETLYMHKPIASAYQTFWCCGPVTSSAEAARPLVIKFYFKKVEVDEGLNTTSQMQTHFGFSSD